MTLDSPERLSFHFGLPLHPVHYLRAKDDFEIGSTPIGPSTICELFQVCLISQEFPGGPGSAACDSGRDQNHLAGGFVSEAGGYCIVLDNLAPREPWLSLAKRVTPRCCVSAIQ